MRKLFLSAIAILALSAAQAQLTKGRILLGGSVGFSTSETTNYLASPQVTQKNNSVTIYPSAGLFVRENLLVGVRLGYGRNTSTTDALVGTENEANYFSAGVFGQRFFPLGSRFYLYGRAGLFYSHGEQKSNDANGNLNNKQITNGVSAGITPGVSFLASKRIMLDFALANFFSVSYNTTDYRNAAGVKAGKSSELNTNILGGGSVPFNIGFNILLGK